MIRKAQFMVNRAKEVLQNIISSSELSFYMALRLTSSRALEVQKRKLMIKFKTKKQLTVLSLFPVIALTCQVN